VRILFALFFAKQATYNIPKIFLKYGNNIESSEQLTDIIEYFYFIYFGANHVHNTR